MPPQDPLPGFPPPMGSLRAWIRETVVDLFPGQTEFDDRTIVRDAVFARLPWTYIQKHLNRIVRDWFTREFNETGRHAWAFPEGNQGKRLELQPNLLPLDAAKPLWIGKLRLSKGDVDSVRRAIQEWADAHPDAQLNVERTLAECLREAGFAA